jgi:hypothetical protein
MLRVACTFLTEETEEAVKICVLAGRTCHSVSSKSLWEQCSRSVRLCAVPVQNQAIGIIVVYVFHVTKDALAANACTFCYQSEVHHFASVTASPFRIYDNSKSKL